MQREGTRRCSLANCAGKGTLFCERGVELCYEKRGESIRFCRVMMSKFQFLRVFSDFLSALCGEKLLDSN
jgi:hypothetical protein